MSPESEKILIPQEMSDPDPDLGISYSSAAVYIKSRRTRRQVQPCVRTCLCVAIEGSGLVSAH